MTVTRSTQRTASQQAPMTPSHNGDDNDISMSNPALKLVQNSLVNFIDAKDNLLEVAKLIVDILADENMAGADRAKCIEMYEMIKKLLRLGTGDESNDNDNKNDEVMFICLFPFFTNYFSDILDQNSATLRSVHIMCCVCIIHYNVGQ